MRKFLAALLFSVTSVLSASTLNQFVVFGDSLSDNGNLYALEKHLLPMSPPYYAGRFSNGPLWIEMLAKKYYTGKETHLLDYAYAGAGIVDGNEQPLFTLQSEIENYLITHQGAADPNSLYVVWIGSNNYLIIPEHVDESVHNVTEGVRIGLKRLAEKGAKHILVLNLPDLGETPYAREYDSIVALSESSKKHNALLQADIDGLKKTFPDVEWLTFNIETSLDDMVKNPSKYGLRNVMDTCYESAMQNPTLHRTLHPMLAVASTIKAGTQNHACDGYLFFDQVHPTALAHQILADRAYQTLQNAGVHFVN